jgi:TRAP-type mannitol/chloroaromatic compound transport system permease small subunit
MRALERLGQRIDGWVEAIGRIAAWTTFALVAVMSTNVLLRYLFSTGSVWAQELEWHLLAPICLFGMAYVLGRGEHVRVDILYARFGRRTQHAVDLLAAVLTVVLAVVVIELSSRYVAQSYRIGEESANPGGIPYRFVLKSLIPIGFALLLVQAVASALKSWLAWARGR